MTTPTGLPTLAAGSHKPTAGKACFMEYASLLAGEAWTDHPACTHPVIASMARTVNDRMGDADRHKLAVLIPSVIGTADLRESELDRQVLSVRLAVWCARQVAHLASDRAVADAAINAAVAWCENPCDETRTAAYAAFAAAAAAADAAAAAADAAYAAYAAAAAAPRRRRRRRRRRRSRHRLRRLRRRRPARPPRRAHPGARTPHRTPARHGHRGRVGPGSGTRHQGCSMSRPLEILGITQDGEIAFRFGDGETLTLGEDDLTQLTAAITRTYLPLWPTSPCRDCGADSVATIEGADYCEGHAMGWTIREMDAGRWGL